MLRHSRENMKRKPVGVRIIHGDEFRSRVHKCGNKGQVARKAVELRDHQLGFVLPAGSKGVLQLRPVVSLARLDFRELGNDAPVAAVQIIGDRLLPPSTRARCDPAVRC